MANAQLASVAQETLKERRGSAVDQAATRAVSALSPKRIEADIVANMERWRWLPPELGDRYILVNVPEFTLRYITHGVVTHKARVIVGKPSSPTPLFSGDMKFLVVNPSWYVPPSILKKEFLPKLAEDPLYAERQGYEVFNTAIASRSVNRRASAMRSDASNSCFRTIMRCICTTRRRATYSPRRIEPSAMAA